MCIRDRPEPVKVPLTGVPPWERSSRWFFNTSMTLNFCVVQRIANSYHTMWNVLKIMIRCRTTYAYNVTCQWWTHTPFSFPYHVSSPFQWLTCKSVITRCVWSWAEVFAQITPGVRNQREGEEMSLAKQLINCTGPGWDFRNVKWMVATTAQWFSFLGDANQPSKSIRMAFLPLES